MRNRVALRRVAFAVLLVLVPAGCNTPEAVADFCESANHALSSSVPIFADLQGSCLRVVNLEKGIGSFEVVASDPGCAAIGQQADGAVAAAEILGEYFEALHALAKFGVAKTGSDANDLATKAAGLSSAGADAQTAIGSIAKFLTTAATGAYQTKSLNKDIQQANTNVAAVTKALTEIIQTNYVQQELGDEDKKLAVHYKEFAKEHPEGQVTVLLEERWQTDHRRLATRRAAAADAVLALGAMRDGMAVLAANAGKLKARELPGLLDPYISQLQDLIPQIQKAF